MVTESPRKKPQKASSQLWLKVMYSRKTKGVRPAQETGWRSGTGGGVSDRGGETKGTSKTLLFELSG